MRASLHYSTRTPELFERFIWMPFILPLILLSPVATLFPELPSTALLLIIPIIASLDIFIIRKFQFKKLISALLLVGSGVLIVYITSPIYIFLNLFIVELSIAAGILLLIGFVFVLYQQNKRTSVFSTSKSFLKEFLRETNLKPNPNIHIRSQHSSYLRFNQNPQIKSAKFGHLERANVIVFAVESMGKHFMKYFPDSVFLKKVSENAIISNNHYAICPNTNQFFEHFYGANYPSHLSYPFLPALINCGYKTALISSSDFNLWNTRALIDSTAFEKCWDANKLRSLSNSKGDAMMLAALPLIEKLVDDGPFFLHFQNEQTHYPYFNDQVDKYNNFRESSVKSRYLNALDESLSIFAGIFEQLNETIPMDNTIIIFTGDHGEAFGELGYKAHSNSTVNAQTLVPFSIRHPKLDAEEITYSSHFDVMPTVFDLLGIEYGTQHPGKSVFNGILKPPEILYSQTRKANAPANLCAIINEEKIMLDRVMGYYFKMSMDEKEINELHESEIDYFQSLIFNMAKKRGLINN
jgi:glucan phosphoethanolaminetransferase (alkaline phosphatase superfamily)